MSKSRSFQFGQWTVHPALNTIARADERRQMEPRAMDVLLVFCEAGGAIVSSDDLMTRCWGTTVYGDNPVHKTVAQLRRLLGDSAAEPAYIETIRKRGYRTLAPIAALAPEAPAAPSWRLRSPFRGLLAFDEEHAEVFFGRGESTRRLAQVAASQLAGGYAMLMLLGPSGSGKTSLVRAGLFPALAAGAAGVRLAASTAFDMLDQGEHSLYTVLGGALLDLQREGVPLFPDTSAFALGERLAQDCAGVVAQLAGALAPPGPGERQAIGLFVDRLEALFDPQGSSEAERLAFLATLDQLAASGAVLLVVACRNDFYPQLVNYPTLMRSKAAGGHVDLGPPSFADMAQIIRLPAQAAGLRFEADPHSNARLDDVLCESAIASPDALPLLQYCLQELYRLRDGDALTFAAFHQMGGVEGAIGQRAEQVVAGMSEAELASLPQVMALTVSLSANGSSVTGQRAPWSALPSEAARKMVEALVASRLFVSDLTGGVPGFGVAHEAILRRWPRLTQWVETHKAALTVRGRLAQQAARWVAEGRSNDLLLPPGRQLDEARALAGGAVFVLGADELQMIRVSSQRSRLRERMRLGALGAIVTLALLAGVLGARAVAARQVAEQRRAEVESLVGFMLGDFADKLRPLGRLDLLDSVSAKALQYLERPDQHDSTAAEQTQRVKALQVIGEVSRSRGKPERAIEALRTANAILQQQFQASPGDAEVLKNLGTNAYWIGQIYKDQNNFEAAGVAWNDYARYAERLHQLEPAKVEWWVEQSYAHNNLGALAMARSDPQLAAPNFTRSIALKQRALAQAPDNSTVMAELADSYSWLGSTREALGELAAAQSLYAQELDMVAQLRTRFPGEAMWIARHARALQHRAAMELAGGRDARALADFSAAKLELQAMLRQDPANRTRQSEVALLEQEELRVLAASGAADAGAGARLEQLQQQLQGLTRFDPKNIHWARRAALGDQQLAAHLAARAQFAPALAHLQPAVASLERLYAANPSNKTVRAALVETLLLAARVHAGLDNPGAAQAACRRVHGMLQAEAGASRYYLVLEPWVRTNYCLNNPSAADSAVKKLAQMGYRATAYSQFLSTHQK